MNLQFQGVYIDCTLGGGGHSYAMLHKESTINLYCFDRDDDAIRYSQKKLLPYKKQVKIIKDNFKDFRSHMALQKINKVDGILMDLGVSNHQISDSKRGFSYLQDDFLDMRMDKTQLFTAFELVNSYSLNDLKKIFFEYGEENHSKKIAENIVKQRQISEIRTTKELASIVENSVPDKSKKSLIKSKARIFQAIRIKVNNELEILSSCIKDAISTLKPQGRLLVISWHSLEDRIVKECLREESIACVCHHDVLLCRCNHKKRIKLLTKRPIVPSEKEVAVNSNCRSAKLRVAERI